MLESLRSVWNPLRCGLATHALATVSLVFGGAGWLQAAEPIQLFNGKDFAGWHGRTTIDPRKWESTPEADKAKWNQEIADHWKVDGNEIVNDQR
jgi:hypothetical protein